MNAPSLTFLGRLPGVDCSPALPPAEQPIRGDIAAFVGFAERGPIDTPVPVVDHASFTAVFGGDYVLASDGGTPVYASLPSAVKAFFDNGGVRCYAVRVTGPNPATARWELPGIEIWQPDGTVGNVVVDAAWPGSWSSGLQVSTAPFARPLAADAVYERAGAAPGRLDLRSRGAAAAVQPGDLLDLDLGPGRPRLYVRAGATADGVLTAEAELTYLPADAGSPPQSDLPDPDALDSLPPVLLGVSVRLLRMDLVVQRLEDGLLQLVERFPDLAYGSFEAVLQPPIPDRPRSPMQPALDRSMDLRASTADDRAAATGLIVPVAGPPAGPPLIEGDEKLGTFDPVAVFLDELLPAGVTAFSLINDADALTTLATDPVQLRGIYSLLAVDEVAMIACPDLAQRGWFAVEPLPPDPEPPATPPPPPPDWSDFRCCEVETAPAPEPPAALAVTTLARPVRELDRIADFQEEPMRRVQEALITLCAARADLVALLSVPQHYDTAAVLSWHERLTSSNALAASQTSAFTPLSYAAYWHPWLTVPEPRTPQRSVLRALPALRTVPPDGAIAGMIAARELARGIWVAPAAVALRGPVALTPRLTDLETVRLFDAHANVIRQRPGSFAAIAAHTLADGALLQLSVRRLLIWLRRIALRAGMRYTFEVNNERFRALVRRRFERILAGLAQRGAWHDFRVRTDEGLTAGDDIENGRLVITLQVAPTSPVEFITVTLVRSGEGLLEVAEG
jgi:hypothetical protein